MSDTIGREGPSRRADTRARLVRARGSGDDGQVKRFIWSNLPYIAVGVFFGAAVVAVIVDHGWAAVTALAPPFAPVVAYFLLTGPVPWRRYFRETRAGSAVLVAAVIGAWLGFYLSFASFHDLFSFRAAGGVLPIVLFAAMFSARWDLLGPKREIQLPADAGPTREVHLPGDPR